ncbi:MAG: acyltransferase [Limisphaerales bacterium]
MPFRSWSERIGSLLQFGRQSLSILWTLEARLKGCSLGRRTQFAGRPIISVAKGSRMVFGDGVRICSSLRANLVGCFQPCVLRTLSNQAELVLDSGVGISATVICSAASVRVGEGTIMGSGAMVLDTDFHPPQGEWGWGLDPQSGARPVRIGRGVFIGARAIILKGVTIGDRAVIGAGAVVTKDVPGGCLAFGNPAQVRPQKSQPKPMGS